MRDIITEPEWAYEWAGWIGDRKIMRDRVVDKKYIELWLRNIPSYHGIMRKRLHDK
jgi:hypothetical protein